MRRVVITGMGIYSCIGKNQDEVKDSLFQGRSGIGIDPARKEMGYFSALTGLLQTPAVDCTVYCKSLYSPLYQTVQTTARDYSTQP